MTAVEHDETIQNALIKAHKAGGKELKEKLQILLSERKVPVIAEPSQIECLSILGTGAFGRVELIRYRRKYYAQKRALQRTAPQLISIIDEGIKLTDIREEHRNIQRLNFINLDCYGIIIDYCSNGSLHSFISNQASKYSLKEVLSWSYQLADALSFLHNHDMIHRDVKTQNILLKDDGETLVLTDYGTATQMKKIQMTNNVGTPSKIDEF